jgi:hypothetical protein
MCTPGVSPGITNPKEAKARFSDRHNSFDFKSCIRLQCRYDD